MINYVEYTNMSKKMRTSGLSILKVIGNLKKESFVGVVSAAA